MKGDGYRKTLEKMRDEADTIRKAHAIVWALQEIDRLDTDAAYAETEKLGGSLVLRERELAAIVDVGKAAAVVIEAGLVFARARCNPKDGWVQVPAREYAAFRIALEALEQL